MTGAAPPLVIGAIGHRNSLVPAKVMLSFSDIALQVVPIDFQLRHRTFGTRAKRTKAARVNVLVRIRTSQIEDVAGYDGAAALEDLENYDSAGTVLAAI